MLQINIQNFKVLYDAKPSFLYSQCVLSLLLHSIDYRASYRVNPAFILPGCNRVSVVKEKVLALGSPEMTYKHALQGVSKFYLHTHAFIRERYRYMNLCLSSRSWSLFYQPRRDGRLSIDL